MGFRLTYEILSVVEEIPEGKVATYGQITRLISRDKNSRLVGKVLSRAEFYGRYPCHRVVNHAGRLDKYLRKQRKITQEEFAEYMMVSRQTISKWESEDVVPELNKLIEMCDYF